MKLTVLWVGINQDALVRAAASASKLTGEELVLYPENSRHPSELPGILSTLLGKQVVTNSENLVNLIGEAINLKKLSPEFVIIKKVDPDLTVEMFNYSVDGYLVNWPYGFFSCGSIRNIQIES